MGASYSRFYRLIRILLEGLFFLLFFLVLPFIFSCAFLASFVYGLCTLVPIQ